MPASDSGTLAESYAATLKPSPVWRRVNGKTVRKIIEARFDRILAVVSDVGQPAVNQMPQTRWLLDNSHLVRQALQLIETDLPASYYQQLQSCTTAKHRRVPRVFSLVDQAIERSGLPVDLSNLQQLCREYHAKTASASRLTLGELWAIPIALRILLLNRLCEAAESGLSQSALSNADGITDVTTQIAGCITSIRDVSAHDWPQFVEDSSCVERILRQDPVKAYSGMDFDSRDDYRRAVEGLARQADIEQHKVAEVALRLARETTNNSDAIHHRHIGYFLTDKGRLQLESALKITPSIAYRSKRLFADNCAILYFSAVISIAAIASTAFKWALSAGGAGPIASTFAAVIAFLPLLSVSIGGVNFAVTLLSTPRRLSKMDFSGGIPEKCRTFVVVPVLLGSREEISQNLITLEQNFLGNPDPQLRFALLTDYLDAASAETPDDDDLLDHAKKGIDHLNDRYATDDTARFYLFHRRRLWNEKEGCWMGWERKRGKLEEFNELLRGSLDTSYVIQYGGQSAQFGGIRYVITLDADSFMPSGTAARLIGTLAHPLNQARYDQKTRHYIGGYTVLQPRLEINPTDGTQTRFARVFAGDVLLDLYTHAVSDTYQDLFAEAVFAGKGIYDLDAFRHSVVGQIPINSVLSHDLLEGLLGRAGLASDIVVLEDYPENYLIYLKRLHRWTRGDWQLLPWLLPGRAPGSRPFRPGFVGFWKIFDNLRRSLAIPAIFGLLVCGWLFLPGDPLAWTLLIALIPGLPILLRVTLAFRTSLWRWGTVESSLRNLVGHAGADIGRWLLALIFLPVETYITLDAIIRSVYRISISHRHMLEWSTAATISRSYGSTATLGNFWKVMWFGPAVSVLIAVFAITMDSAALLIAMPFLIAWFASPMLAHWLRRGLDQKLPEDLPDTDKLLIRGLARDTWRFFERFVGPETQWLPPDNVQEFPKRTIAERTSPTNIGMMLLSTLSAFDLGYIGQRQLQTRLSEHLRSILRLRKYRGHLLNWYSTRDLAPLEPQYVSTVDSGNFVAALIATRQALKELPQESLTVERTSCGLLDDLTALRRQLHVEMPNVAGRSTCSFSAALAEAQAFLESDRCDLDSIAHLEQRLCKDIESAFLHELEQSPGRWSAEEIAFFRENARVLRQTVRFLHEDILSLAPWSVRIASPPTLLLTKNHKDNYLELVETLERQHNNAHSGEAVGGASELMERIAHSVTAAHSDTEVGTTLAWLRDLEEDIESGRNAFAALNDARQRLIGELTQLIEATDFDFLYDATRHLFRVGYNVSAGEPDSSYYDLLASEARIASFVAIAKGDVPPQHWMHLGRPLTRIHGLRILLSWSATAFEYLMPRLLLHSPPNGLISQSCAGMVKEQIRFGHKHGIPWGVSESGFAQFDQQNHYQYFAFGIPNLGLKWDQGERLVVSSYASILALPYAPAEVIENLHRLFKHHAVGHYGLFEGLDFGNAHQSQHVRPRVVQSYMAHHQGMILVAIGNILHGDRIPQRLRQDPMMAAAEYLLHERLPQRMQTRPLERLPSPLKEVQGTPATVSQWQVDSGVPEVALLSNGRLTCQLSNHGGGALYWRGNAGTRWNPYDEGPTSGTRLYIKDIHSEGISVIGGLPLADDSVALFAPHAAEFRTRCHGLLSRMTITIAPDTDTEIRRISITNDGSDIRRILLSSYCEPVLGSEAADRRHTAFNKLFIESSCMADNGTLIFRRRPREPDELPLYLAHKFVAQSGDKPDYSIELDRNAFIGRSRDSARPAALADPEYVFDNSGRSTLDPCAAIIVALTIPARTTVQCAFLTTIGDSRRQVLDALQSFQTIQRVQWSVEAARLQSERELTAMHMTSETVRSSFQMVARSLWPTDLAHINLDTYDGISQVQDALWRQGVSGDRPITALRIDGEEDIVSAEQLLGQIHYLDRKAFPHDILFLDESKGGYTFPTIDRLRHAIDRQLNAGYKRDGAQAYIVPSRNFSSIDRSRIIAASTEYIDMQLAAGESDIAPASAALPQMPAFVPQPSAPLADAEIEPVCLPHDLEFSNRYGGLTSTQDAYVMLISGKTRTPAPWCNILCNRDFGTIVSESGSMCTWWGNSSEYRLTPWNNDPVLDRTGEAVYVRDEETGEAWCLTPQNRDDAATYRVSHAIGESLYEHNRNGLEQCLQVFVDPDKPLKYLRVKLHNRWPRARRLTITFAVDWVLANTHEVHRHLLLPERDTESDALLVRNAYNRNAGNELAFVSSSLPAHGVTCDGNEFFGLERSWSNPPGLAAVGLSDRVRPGNFPCAIYQVHVNLDAGERRNLHFVLGAANDRSEADKHIRASREPEWVDERRTLVQSRWADLLTTWTVSTPDAAIDALTNQWLLYQVISSRLWGRIGFYQASGGFGYRDQLQDVLALLDTAPDAALEQIRIAAAMQFEDGDVLHWWHDSPLRGVRTRCSDDLLWLPFAVAEYIDVTGTDAVLHERATFLQGEPLRDHEQERYAEFQSSRHDASLYEHCCRAIDARLVFGAHGMPLIGSGDWNDGLNRVGQKGLGESVWMAWFLIMVLRRFAPLCRAMEDADRADHYDAVASALLERTRSNAWTGHWYVRGYYDDGSALGAPGDSESEIDLNAQTWAAFVDPEHPNTLEALRTARQKLVDSENRLIKLLTPPFDKTTRDPGYIRSYPPGVRENGGQYTHAAVWAAWAAVQVGDRDRANQWFEWLNPFLRGASSADLDRYRLEPYVTAGDIYGGDTLAGRGGWSWYTGSAAWLYRFAIRQLLGLQRRGQRLWIQPCLPDAWSQYSATLRHERATYQFHIHAPGQIEKAKLFIVEDGVTKDVPNIELQDTGNHTVEIFASDDARRAWVQNAHSESRHAAENARDIV